MWFDQHVVFFICDWTLVYLLPPRVGIDNSDWEGEREMEADQKVMSYFFLGILRENIPK